MSIEGYKKQLHDLIIPEVVKIFGEKNVFVDLIIRKNTPKGLADYGYFEFLIITKYGLLFINSCFASGKNGKFAEKDLESVCSYREMNLITTMLGYSMPFKQRDVLGKIALIVGEDSSIKKLKEAKYFQKYNKKRDITLCIFSEDTLENAYEKLLEVKKQEGNIRELNEDLMENDRKHICFFMENGTMVSYEYRIHRDKEENISFVHRDVKVDDEIKSAANNRREMYEPYMGDDGRVTYVDEEGHIHKDYIDEDDYANDPDNY